MSYWVVEVIDSDGPLYLAGFVDGSDNLTIMSAPMTIDAIQFVREQDAIQVAGAVLDEGAYRTVEIKA